MSFINFKLKLYKQNYTNFEIKTFNQDNEFNDK